MREPNAPPWRQSVLIGLAVVVIGMLISVVYPHQLYGRRAWLVPSDFWWTLKGAHYVASGALGYVYEGAPFFYGLPVFLILLAPFAAVGFSLNLTEQVPYFVPFPTMWLLVGPVVLATVIPLCHAMAGLARRCGAAGSLLGLQLAAVVVVFGPIAMPYGRFEDALALAFTVFGYTVLLGGRPLEGAALLSVGIASKTWAVLALPLFLAMTPPGRRVKTTLAAIALPAALASFTLAVDWSHASRTLLGQKAFFAPGQWAPWVPRRPREVGLSATVERVIAVLVATGAAPLLAERLRRWPSKLPAALGLILLVRFVLEPVPPPYYLSPPLALLLISERLRTGRVRVTSAIGAVALALFLVHSLPALWWPAEVLLCAIMAAPAIRDLFARDQVGSPPPMKAESR